MPPYVHQCRRRWRIFRGSDPNHYSRALLWLDDQAAEIMYIGSQHRKAPNISFIVKVQENLGVRKPIYLYISPFLTIIQQPVFIYSHHIICNRLVLLGEQVG